MRIEDERLLTGRGCFTADVDVLGQLHAAFLRADRAHAEIRAIDTAAARAASGIHAVLTGEDVARAGLRGLPCVMSHADRGLRPFIAPHRPCLAQGRVRFVGEPVALIVADSLAAALDAAELVTVDYGELPAVVEPEQAAMAGAPAIWPEIPDNICFEWEVGDAAAVAEARRNAAHVVPLRVVNNRVVANPLEPRAVIATYDPARGDYNIRLGTQGMRIMRAQLATVLGVAEERVHVATADVGGAFGAKTPAYPEYGALLLAARQTGRPIKWVSTRAEAFLSEHHGRDSVMAGELMLDRDGGFLGLDVRFSAAMGAYLSSHGPLIATLNPSNGISGIYRIPTIHGRMRCVMTNTAPTGPYRGAGRPEMALFIERIVDAAAREIGIDGIELRRRNLVRTFPHKTATGVVYDGGDFAGLIDRALALSDWAGFAARRHQSAANGKLRGRGVSAFLEATTASPNEEARIEFRRDGGIDLHVGTQASGQGHETTFAFLVATRLCLPPESVRLVQGDATRGIAGGPSVGSRSLVATGSAVARAATQVVARGRELAAQRLEANPEDIRFEDGRFVIAGTDRAVTLRQLVADAFATLRANQPSPLDQQAAVAVPWTFPSGCYIAEVEIDPETGAVTVASFVCVDDCGTVIEPALAEGQVHGGVAQGLGQALCEHCIYAPETGQLLTGSLMDYAMPRADDLPPLRSAFHPVPTATNPLGVKGVGEAGTTGSAAALLNAVVDALAERGVHHIDMPLTPQRIWAALR
ncbi:MAG TPA: xanthine dehydrogenase family protein molybdopterin-binding subunit [Alphaproteobacteria bacterium]|nr:xanthine dehydrogenase family protein molybdopterin-binding subunit [Alphaproteobacteria bacterium]